MLVLLGAVGVRPADRVRERGRPADRPRRVTPPRVRGANRARRRARPPDRSSCSPKASCSRSPVARSACWWRSWTLQLLISVAPGQPAAARTTSRSTGASRCSRSSPRSCVGVAVRSDAGAAVVASGVEFGPEGWRPHRHRAHRPAQRHGRRASRAGARAADRRRPDADELLAAAIGRSRASARPRS